jgi:Secretion system C-terminal sorting domain
MKKIYLLLFSVVYLASADAQCFMDQHNTNWNDGWLSCETSASPNTNRGKGHWIMYSLGYKYALGQSRFWNHNEADALNNGVRSFALDVSLDGIDWTEWKVFDLPMAPGSPIYEGVDGPDLEKIPARYILLTALDNYGGPCYGFAEMKVDVEVLSQTENETDCVSINAFPNPFTDQVYINVSGKCAKNGNIVMEDLMGRQVTTPQSIGSSSNTITINTVHLTPGIYVVKLSSEEGTTLKKVIKAE